MLFQPLSSVKVEKISGSGKVKKSEAQAKWQFSHKKDDVYSHVPATSSAKYVLSFLQYAASHLLRNKVSLC